MYRSTQQRDYVSKIVQSNPVEALKVAHAIEDPWFRCQSLTAVAYHSTDIKKKSALLKEAFQAATLTEQPNRIVTVSSWPLEVLCSSGQDVWLNGEAGRLLAIIAREPSPVKRSDALNALLGAVVSGPRIVFWRVFEPFLDACRARLVSGRRNAKGQARLSHWILVTDRFDPTRTPRLLEEIEGPILRAEAEANLEKYKHLAPEEWCGWPNLR